MTKMKKFIVVVVGALALTSFTASPASAAQCEPFGPYSAPSITNDPGVAVLPFSYVVDSNSTTMRYSWRMLPEGVYPSGIGASGYPGSWKVPILATPRDGTIEIFLEGFDSNEVGFCAVQVKNAISDVRFKLVGKPGKQRIVAEFDRRRADVTTKLVVTQKVKKKRKKGKGKKAQVSTRTLNGFSAKVKPGALVTATLIPSAGGYELDRLETTSSPMKAKKKKKKRKK